MEAFVTYRSRLKIPDAPAGKPEDMPVAHFSRFVDLEVAGKARQSVVSGNEPTLHPDFEALLNTAEKKGLALLLETTGLMPDNAVRAIRDRRLPLTWRFHERRLYSDGDWNEMTARLTELGAKGRTPMHLLAVTHDPSVFPDEAIQWLRKLQIRDITFRVVRPATAAALRPYAARLAAAVTELTAAGHRVVLDCGLPPCAFTDEDFGRLARVGAPGGSCNPRPGVRPDLRIYHCREMLDYPGAALALFKTPARVTDYFYQRHNDLQWDLHAYPQCLRCPSLHTRVCGGECMAVKAAVLEREQAELAARAETEDADVELLATLGRICYELCRFRDAAACFEEARRLDPSLPHVHLLLARTYWESGDPAGAEEEFRKAARLLPDGKAVMLELLKRLQSKGNLFKSRRLAEEIKRMPPEGPAAGS
jgi:radical SAM protein with 4Fe4S-binding SPASM domain